MPFNLRAVCLWKADECQRIPLRVVHSYRKLKYLVSGWYHVVRRTLPAGTHLQRYSAQCANVLKHDRRQ